MSELSAEPEARDMELAPTTRSREVVIPGSPQTSRRGGDSACFGSYAPVLPWLAAGKAAGVLREERGCSHSKNEETAFLEASQKRQFGVYKNAQNAQKEGAKSRPNLPRPLSGHKQSFILTRQTHCCREIRAVCAERERHCDMLPIWQTGK